ncbi:MAG: SlyX family protein [Nannocystaceae bacterium]
MADPRAEDRIRALEERLVDLEVRFAFQQQTLDDLDSVVREFAVRVERLEGALAELRAAPAHGEGGDGPSPL